MTRPALDGTRAKSIATQMDEEAKELQELLAELIDAHALRRETAFFRQSTAARLSVKRLRDVLDALKTGKYQDAERLLGMNIEGE